MRARTIPLEKKGVQALKGWLALRPQSSPYPQLFPNRDGEPLKEWGRDLLAKYCTRAGITKRVTPHALRHTFATRKAEAEGSPFQLKEWLGHARLDTTSIYVHLARQSANKVMEATSL